jgi:hypothetical protein
MGEAKRNRERRASEPCICGSSKAAGTCCFDGRSYTKQPAEISLSNPTGDLSVDGCYLGHTGGCGGPISKEHLISESVLNVLNQGELLTLTGAAWQLPGESRKIGLSALTAKCLCKHHNNTCLSPLDAAAGQFFAAIKSASSNESAPPLSMLVSGHDIERWMLKTLFALAHGKILAREGRLLPKRFYGSIDEVQLLTSPTAWPVNSGLYSTQFVGQLITQKNQLDIAPITMPGSDELIGLRFSILGLSFDFLADLPQNIESGGTLVLHRPGRLIFRHGSIVNEVLISWIDGREHPTVNFDSVPTE